MVDVTVIDPTAQPEIDVTANGAAIPVGGVALGRVEPNTGRFVSVTVKNLGDSVLVITNPSSLVSTTGFTQLQSLPASLAVGGSATVSIRFLSTTWGTHLGQVSIASNDQGSTPFEFDISATVKASCSSIDDLLEWDLWGVLEEGQPREVCAWRDELSPNFNAWQNGSSQNTPVMAAAVALLFEPLQTKNGVVRDYRDWWVEYLSGQLHDNANLPTTAQYFHGTEAFSVEYDSRVVVAVLAAHHWALEPVNAGQPRVGEIENLAQEWLRGTWTVYALSSSPSSALVGYVHRTEGSPEVYDPWHSFYSGPFLALPAARTPQRKSVAERGSLFARALLIGFTNNQENPGQKKVVGILDDNSEVWGLSSSERDNLKDLLDHEWSSTLWTAVKGYIDRVRTRAEMHFLGWGNGVRAAYMTYNPNKVKQTNTFAYVYKAADRSVHVLHPWQPANYQGGRHIKYDGMARLFNGGIEASSRSANEDQSCPPGPAQPFCQHPYVTVRTELPAGPAQFHVVLSDDSPPSLGSVTAHTAPSSACLPPSSAGLLGHWDFEDTGALGVDSSSAAHHGTPIGLPLQVTGRDAGEKALKLTGSNYISLPPLGDDLNQQTAVTLEGWMKVDIHSWLNGLRTWRPFILSSDRFYFGNFVDSTGWHFLTSPSPVPVGEWYHIAGVFENGVMRLYVNGELAAETTVPVNRSDTAGNYFDTAIGARNMGTNGVDGYFVGELDDLKIYTRALSAGEIQRAAGCP